MKKILLLHLLSLVIVLSACSVEEKMENDLVFDTLSVSSKIHLFDNPSMPYGEVSFALQYPVSGGSKDQLIEFKRLYNTFVFGLDDTLSVQRIVDLEILRYAKEYKEKESEYLAYQKNGNREMLSALSIWAMQRFEKDTVLYNKNQLVSLMNTVYRYDGGAHGMTTVSTKTIFLTEMRFLTLEDLFIGGALEKLPELMQADLKKQKGKQLEEEGYDMARILPTENFYITDEGITFQYGQYDLGPYSLGSPDFTFSFEILKMLLREDSPIAYMWQ